MKNELYKNLMKSLILSLTFLFFAAQAMATNVQIDLAYFNQNPTTNRTVSYQAMSPVPGNVFFTTSDSTGTAILSNCPNTLININILAPPAKTFIQVQLLAGDGGLIDATNRLASGSSSTYPAGQTAWAIATSDQRYQLSGSAQSNSFYPLFSNPSNYINSASLNNATSSIYALLPQTNGYGNIVASNASSFVTPVSLIDATNKDYAAWLTAIQGTNNLIRGQLQYGSGILTNLSNTGAWTNSLVAGTNATLSTNLGVVTINIPTPSFLTNGFTDKSITNGLATTNYVNTATNGFVTSAITNGFATTNYVNSATNGFATTNYVNTSTNTIGVPSGLMAFQLTNVWATYNALTNYITITSNGITAGTGISAATATNIVKANAWLLGGNTNSGFFGTLSNQTLNIGANSMTGLVITAFSDANDTNFYFNFGSKNTLTNFYNSAILSGEGNYLASPFFGFYPFPVGGYAGLIGGGYYNTNQGEDFAVILMGYRNSITADPYTLIGNGSSNSVGSDYASILNGYGNTIVINPSGVLDFGETIINGGNNFLQSPYSWIGGGIGNTIIYNTAGVSSPDYNAIINGTGNSITNSKNSTISSGVGNSIKSANGSFILGSSATINSNNVAIFNDGSITSSKTNSQMILVFTNGVSINTNYANGYALFVNGSINATNMYVNGVAVATTSSAGSVGGLTNITVSTNGTVYTVSVPTQAFLTNGFTTMVYSNPVNMATVAYVNAVGLGATNLAYLVGQGGTNLSYLIGQASTNSFNAHGVNLTNIATALSNNILNFVLITNGTAFYPTLKSNITLGVFPWLTTSTNVLGINGAGVVPANGTYMQIAVGTWTNIIGNGSDVIFQNPTYFLRTNLVNLYSTSNLFFNSTWLNVVGSSAVPTNSGFGYIANHNGQWDTNLWAQSLIGIVPMNSLDTTKVVTNNSSPNFNSTAVGNLTVNGFQTNNSNVYFKGNITGGKYFGDGFGLTNLNLSITNGGGSIFNTTVIGNQGFLASSNVAFGSSATWFGAHSYNSQDTILSLPTTGSGGITNGGLILWPESGSGVTVANSDGSATLMRIDDITNQATGLVYTGQVTANKFIANTFSGTFTGNGGGLTNLNSANMAGVITNYIAAYSAFSLTNILITGAGVAAANQWYMLSNSIGDIVNNEFNTNTWAVWTNALNNGYTLKLNDPNDVAANSGLFIIGLGNPANQLSYFDSSKALMPTTNGVVAPDDWQDNTGGSSPPTSYLVTNAFRVPLSPYAVATPVELYVEFIGTNANDDAAIPGSSTHPYRTLQRAVALATSLNTNTVIHLSAGYDQEAFNVQPPLNITIPTACALIGVSRGSTLLPFNLTISGTNNLLSNLSCQEIHVLICSNLVCDSINSVGNADGIITFGPYSITAYNSYFASPWDWWEDFSATASNLPLSQLTNSLATFYNCNFSSDYRLPGSVGPVGSDEGPGHFVMWGGSISCIASNTGGFYAITTISSYKGTNGTMDFHNVAITYTNLGSGFARLVNAATGFGKYTFYGYSSYTNDCLDPSNKVTFTGNIYTGTFSGNGSGLTNLQSTSIVVVSNEDFSKLTINTYYTNTTSRNLFIAVDEILNSDATHAASLGFYISTNANITWTNLRTNSDSTLITGAQSKSISDVIMPNWVYVVTNLDASGISVPSTVTYTHRSYQ